MSGSSLKTYGHLMAARRIPSEYEIATSRLHWYVERGFEVETPLADWYRRYQRESPLTGAAWDDFRDPRETTYPRYTAMQRDREAHVDGLLRSIEDGDHDRGITPAWWIVLEHVLPPARYLFHGLQMASAYVGQMAPSGRLTIVGAFQAADQVRRVQRIAYRMAQVRRDRPGFGDDARARWCEDPGWQPARRMIEQLLVTWDWGEAFAGLCLAVAPTVDALWLAELPAAGRAAGDHLWPEVCFSLDEDGRWHRSWAAALVELAIAARPANRDVLRAAVGRWLPVATEAVAAIDGDAGARASARVHKWLGELGVAP